MSARLLMGKQPSKTRIKTKPGVCMQAVAERKSAAKVRAKPESQADKELKAMKAYMKKVSSSKKEAVSFLENAGFIDKNGNLTKPYRS